MPATTQRETRLTIGENEAVETLFEKVQSGHVPSSERMRELILKAGERAIEMHGNGEESSEGPEQRAFYHGLLTGYSVATCLLQQQEDEDADAS
jgi:hypothetical protein